MADGTGRQFAGEKHGTDEESGEGSTSPFSAALEDTLGDVGFELARFRLVKTEIHQAVTTFIESGSTQQHGGFPRVGFHRHSSMR